MLWNCMSPASDIRSSSRDAEHFRPVTFWLRARTRRRNRGAQFERTMFGQRSWVIRPRGRTRRSANTARVQKAPGIGGPSVFQGCQAGPRGSETGVSGCPAKHFRNSAPGRDISRAAISIGLVTARRGAVTAPLREMAMTPKPTPRDRVRPTGTCPPTPNARWARGPVRRARQLEVAAGRVRHLLDA